MWTYDRKYTNVRHTTAAIYTASITLPSHSGPPPGFLHKQVFISQPFLAEYLNENHISKTDTYCRN